ncbi:MAG: hemolysin family protein [candidate division WOR-3 bacterium]
MLKWFRKSPIKSERKLKEIIAEVEDEGVISEDEEELLTAVFRLDRTVAEDVMVPRTDIECISIDKDIETLIEHYRKKRHTKIPVYDGTRDNIVGIIYMTEVLKLWGENKRILAGDLMRLPYFIPYTKNVLSTLREFQKKHISIAIVMDEFGGVAGLLTTEDLIEEIVGELQDELDKEKTMYKKLDDGSVIVPGTFELEQLEEILPIEFENSDIRTVGGLIFAKLNRIPEENESIIIDNIEFTILKATRQRIRKVKVRKT